MKGGGGGEKKEDMFYTCRGAKGERMRMNMGGWVGE